MATFDSIPDGRPDPSGPAEAISRAVAGHFAESAPESCPELLSFALLERWSQAPAGARAMRVAVEPGSVVAGEDGSAVAGDFEVAVSLSCPLGDEGAEADFEAARRFVPRRLASPEFRTAMLARFPKAVISDLGEAEPDSDGMLFVASWRLGVFLPSFANL